MRRISMALALLLLAGCSPDTQDTEAAAAAALQDSTMAVAAEAYDPALFDTIKWVADTAQTNRGAVVWSFSCKKCHGEGGHGDAHMVLAGDTLNPPDFAQPGWRFATDRAELMKYIYTGNTNGMPHWGLEGLKPRDVDAVAGFIQKLVVPPAQ